MWPHHHLLIHFDRGLHCSTLVIMGELHGSSTVACPSAVGLARRLQVGTRRSRRPASIYPVLLTVAVSHASLPWMRAKEAADLARSRSRTASLRGRSPSAAELLRWPRTELRMYSARRCDALWRCIGADTTRTDHVGTWHVMRQHSECMGSSNVTAVN